MTEQDDGSRIPQLVLSLGKNPPKLGADAEHIKHRRRKTLYWNLFCRRAVILAIQRARVVVHGAHVLEGTILRFPSRVAGRTHTIALIPSLQWNGPHNHQSIRIGKRKRTQQ